MGQDHISEVAARQDRLEAELARHADATVRRRSLLRLIGAGTAGAVLAAQPGRAAASLGDALVEGTNLPAAPYTVNSGLGVAAVQVTATGNGGAITANGQGIAPTVQLSTGGGGQPALQVESAGTVDVVVVKGPSRFTSVSVGHISAGGGSNEQGPPTIEALGVDTAVQGRAVAVGVRGEGLVGVSGEGSGMVASSGVGVEARGGLANARLVPSGPAPWDRRSMGGTKVAYQGGELVMDENNELWVCVEPGEALPERFRLLASPSTGLAGGGGFVAIDPVRWWDSREHEPVQGGTALGLPAPAVVPEGAQAVLVNVAVTNTIAGGWLAVYPGPTWPGTSLLNWWAAGQTIANSISVKIGSPLMRRGLWFHAGVSTTDIVVDLYGYYR